MVLDEGCSQKRTARQKQPGKDARQRFDGVASVKKLRNQRIHPTIKHRNQHQDQDAVGNVHLFRFDAVLTGQRTVHQLGLESPTTALLIIQGPEDGDGPHGPDGPKKLFGIGQEGSGVVGFCTVQPMCHPTSAKHPRHGQEGGAADGA